MALVPKPSPKAVDTSAVMLTGLTIALGIALSQPKAHDGAKRRIHDVLVIWWLVYSFYFKDYPVMVVSMLMIGVDFFVV